MCDGEAGSSELLVGILILHAWIKILFRQGYRAEAKEALIRLSELTRAALEAEALERPLPLIAPAA